MNKASFKKEDLGGVSVFCSETHRFGTDAVLLEYFANPSRARTACDMGTGCGIIPTLMLRDNPNIAVTAVDIQPEAIELTQAAAEYNKFGERLKPVLCDINRLDSSYFGKYDLVTMNPPYKKAGAGLMTKNEGLNIARFELKCTFDDAARIAAKLLKPGGRFCVCHRPERLGDIICDMRKYKIEPKRLQTAAAKQTDEPNLVLAEGILGASVGMKILPPICLEDSDGNMSETARRIYRPWLYGKKED